MRNRRARTIWRSNRIAMKKNLHAALYQKDLRHGAAELAMLAVGGATIL